MPTSTRKLNDDERKILDALGKGRDNAVSVPNLVLATGIFDERLLRKLVRHLIDDHGFCIGSSAASVRPGYFLAETKAERIQTAKSLRHRAMSILKRAARVERNSILATFKKGLEELREAS